MSVSPRLRRVAVGVLALAALVAAAWIALDSARVLGLDLRVYRTGGAALFTDPALLYTEGAGSEEGFGLPFTYPTFAAVVFVPFAALPFEVAFAVMTLASLAVVVAVSRDLAPRVVRLWPGLKPWVNPWTLTALWLISGPGRDTLLLGQINFLLLGGVYLALVKGKTLVPFAIAVGLTGGIKLTPLALMLVPLAYGKIKPIIAGGLSFLATQLVSMLVWPKETVQFWTEAVVDPSRVGGVDYLDNLSLRGLVERVGWPSLAWLVLAALSVALLLLIMVRVMHHSDRVVMLGLASLCALLISPISWSHHWVWFPVIAYGLGSAVRALGVRSGTLLHRGAVSALILVVTVLFLSTKLIVRLTGHDPDYSAPAWDWVMGAIAVGGSLLLVIVLATHALLMRSAGEEVSAARH